MDFSEAEPDFSHLATARPHSSGAPTKSPNKWAQREGTRSLSGTSSRQPKRLVCLRSCACSELTHCQARRMNVWRDRAECIFILVVERLHRAAVVAIASLIDRVCLRFLEMDGGWKSRNTTGGPPDMEQVHLMVRRLFPSPNFLLASLKNFLANSYHREQLYPGLGISFLCAKRSEPEWKRCESDTSCRSQRRGRPRAHTRSEPSRDAS